MIEGKFVGELRQVSWYDGGNHLTMQYFIQWNGDEWIRLPYVSNLTAGGPQVLEDYPHDVPERY